MDPAYEFVSSFFCPDAELSEINMDKVALREVPLSRSQNGNMKFGCVLRIQPVTRSNFSLMLPESAPKRQIIGNLQNPTGHQGCRQPASGKHGTAERWADCRSKAARYGRDAGRPRSSGRVDDGHDQGAPGRDIHRWEQRTHDQQSDSQSY